MIVRISILFVFLVLSSLSCTGNPPEEVLPDSRDVLASHLDHGAGPSVFDDPAWQDSVVADALVRLRNGLPVTRILEQTGLDSADVERLRALGLLDFLGDSARTAFPVIIGDQASSYYSETERVARVLLQEYGPSFQDLVAELGSQGFGHSAYHVLWSLVFDAQTAWAAMVDNGTVPPMDQVRSWVIYPTHPFKTGTNMYGPVGDPAYFLAVSWTPPSATISTAEDSWEGLTGALVGGGEGVDWLSAADSGPAEGGRSGVEGTLILRPGEQLTRSILSLAGSLHGEIWEEIDHEVLERAFHGDSRLGFAAAYHDVGWHVLEFLVDEGALTVPDVLLRPTPGNLKGAISLVPVEAGFLRILGLAPSQQNRLPRPRRP